MPANAAKLAPRSRDDQSREGKKVARRTRCFFVCADLTLSIHFCISRETSIKLHFAIGRMRACLLALPATDGDGRNAQDAAIPQAGRCSRFERVRGAQRAARRRALLASSGTSRTLIAERLRSPFIGAGAGRKFGIARRLRGIAFFLCAIARERRRATARRPRLGLGGVVVAGFVSPSQAPENQRGTRSGGWSIRRRTRCERSSPAVHARRGGRGTQF